MKTKSVEWNRVKCGYCGTEFWGSYPNSTRPCPQCRSWKTEWVMPKERTLKTPE